MSAKKEKQTRKEIRKYIQQNKNMVLEEVIDTMIKGKFLERFLFSITILFKRVVKK